MTSTTPSTKLSICFISLNVKLLALVKVQIHQTLDLAEIVILLQHNEPNMIYQLGEMFIFSV